MHVAELIWNSWENGQKIISLPKKLTPSSRKEAYKIQGQLTLNFFDRDPKAYGHFLILLKY